MKQVVNHIGDSGAKMISEGLKRNSTLTKLYLDSDEKEEKEIRINKKEIKKRGKRERNVVWCEIMIMKMIYK